MTGLEWLTEEPTEVSVIPQFNELSVFGETESMAAQVVESLTGKYNPVESFAIAKKWSEMFEVAEDALKALAINSSNEKKIEVILGGKSVAIVSERSLPKKYNYTDPTLATMEAELAELKSRIDERKKLLQTIKSAVADATTGELMQPAQMVEGGMTLAVKYL